MLRKLKPSSSESSRYLLIFGIAFVIGSGAALSEEHDPCGCNAALVNAIYEDRVERADHSATTDMASYLCSLSYEDFKKIASNAGNIGFGLFSLSGDVSESQFDQIKTELQKRPQIANTMVSSQDLLDKHADLNALEKWSECRADCNRHAGVSCWIRNAGYGSIVLYIDYVVQPGDQTRTITLQLKNAESILREPLQFQLVPGITTRSIRQKEENIPVEIKVETAGWKQDLNIQPDLPIPETAPAPFVTPTPIPTLTPVPTPTPAPTATKSPVTSPTPVKTPRHKRHRSPSH